MGRLSVPAPVFYVATDTAARRTVAIVNAQGIDGIGERLEAHLEGFRKDDIALDAVGVVLDADTGDLDVRFTRTADKLERLELPRPKAPGDVLGTPRTGIFILPDGKTPGTLEDILLAAGRLVYPALHGEAEAFILRSKSTFDELEEKERNEIEKRAGTKKATLAAMGAVLRPGKAIQATLEDHRWISDASISMLEMSPCIDFLTRLMAASAEAPAVPAPAGPAQLPSEP